ncbi:hypothetical protein [Nocardia puris]|uniref:Uncharacterized protein n=1 Tax=Nocardia puris TaxID=208602 RepID=A0A366D0Z3_9NOCA|nr:hypothetical protein [Nocardia puris]RBO83616.1 hypothetical protein DFR74_11840 [Nocardia puris]
MSAKFLVAVAVAAVVFGATGCGGDDSTAAPTTAPVSVPTTGEPAATAGSPAPSPSAQTSPVTQAPPADDTAAPTTYPPVGTGPVDAREYQIGDHFYFQSPTGNIKCGFLLDDNFGVGCQLRDATVIPPELPGCTPAPDRAVAAHVSGPTSEFLCLNQGIFVGIPQDGTAAGGKILPYGESIMVRGYSCMSLPDGVRCDSGRDAGFVIAADHQALF